MATLTEKEFDRTMRSFVKRRPFFAFMVELLDGRRIIFENRRVIFGGGAAGFLSLKEGLVGLKHEDVRHCKFLYPETTPDRSGRHR